MSQPHHDKPTATRELENRQFAMNLPVEFGLWDFSRIRENAELEKGKDKESQCINEANKCIIEQ